MRIRETDRQDRASLELPWRTPRDGFVVQRRAAALNIVRRCRWPALALCHSSTTTDNSRARKPAMSIDFEVPAEAKAIREKVRQWVHDECIPAEKELDTKPLEEVLGKLRKKARAQGLWCPFVPKEYGGMGLGPLANALVQMELGESMLGAL